MYFTFSYECKKNVFASIFVLISALKIANAMKCVPFDQSSTYIQGAGDLSTQKTLEIKL